MHRVRIVEPSRCPQCGDRMARFTNGQGRGWEMCRLCGAQAPTESRYREVRDGVEQSQGDSGGAEKPA